MRNSILKTASIISVFFLLNFAFLSGASAQEKPPAPSAPSVVKIPAVQQRILPNKLKVAVVQRKNVPLVTVQLLIKSGASEEEIAGLADMTASLLTKGTKIRTATQIAEEMEFLGGGISAGAGWNASQVVVNIMPDKLDQAMAIMSDVVLNPAFAQSEIDLLKSQTLDGLSYNLKQPGFLASYVASKYSFDEHPAGGTVESINKLTRENIENFYKVGFQPQDAVLIFSGDITAAKAFLLAQKFFGKWRSSPVMQTLNETPYTGGSEPVTPKNALVKRILVIDLPNSGQASVNYAKKLDDVGRVSKTGYFPATVLNSILGGGYSSRLNQEIRIKRGLSYGAGSSFGWRWEESNFSTRTQTKNESAAEVAELVIKEIQRLGDSEIPSNELTPRKAVLTGTFGRSLETTGGLAGQIGDLYSFGLPVTQLNTYMASVNKVTDAEIMRFASANLKGGDMIIVGDAKIFMDDLKKRFPGMSITVIKADELDVSKDNLRK